MSLEDAYKGAGLPSTHLYDKWEEGVVKNIMNYSKETLRGVLLILDNMTCCEKVINNKQNNLLRALFYQGRHYKVSLVIISQKMKDIPLSLRVNSTHLICFNLKNAKEEESFFEENRNIREIESKYKTATEEPFSFLYINKVSNVAYKNFECEL